MVVAMAHLWSKFTKCLRSSKGASDPGLLPSPNVVPSAHNAAPFAIITSLLSPPRGSNEILPPFIYRSLFRSTSPSFVLRSQIRISSLCNLPSESKILPLIMNITLIRKYFLLRLSIFQRCDVLSFIYEYPSVKHDWRKLPSELIAVRYLTKYAHAYNWILFMDFIQNVYRCINYKRRARKVREDRPSSFDSRSQLGLPLLSS